MNRSAQLPTSSSHYLEKLSGISSALKQYLINKMFFEMGVNKFKDIEENIGLAIETLYKKPLICAKRAYWVSCVDKCDEVVRHLTTAEMESTAFMLHCIAESVLPSTERIEINVTPGAELTGKWNDDKHMFVISSLGDIERKSRLIMGFGPSAAGKTHWATTIINLMQMSDPTFPTAFLSIDGGIYRASSAVYAGILKGAETACVLGFRNLVRAGLSSVFGKSLFDADIVKKAVMDYLEDSEVPISLYVPDTLGGCGGFIGGSCVKKYDKYINLANDPDGWIGLLIWQHVTANTCEFLHDAARKCVGCTESGTSREMKEGKKYSSTAYSYSMANGEDAIKRAPGGRYKIHNCGRPGGISILEDHTPDSIAHRQIANVLQRSAEFGKYDYKFLA